MVGVVYTMGQLYKRMGRKSLHVAEEAHRDLKLRAAREGKNIEEIILMAVGQFFGKTYEIRQSKKSKKRT